MRNIRTAAIASATAATLAIAGIAPASAQGDQKPAAPATDKPVIFVGEVKDRDAYVDKDGNIKTPTDKAIGDVIKDSASGPGSSKAVNDADQPFFIQDAFGDKTNPEAVPQWARIWIDSAVIAGIGALVGLVIAGFNFASYNGWINF